MEDRVPVEGCVSTSLVSKSSMLAARLRGQHMLGPEIASKRLHVYPIGPADTTTLL